MTHADGLSTMPVDQRIKGWKYLLNTTLLLRELQHALPQIEIQSIQKHYIRYKPGTSLLVCYQMQADNCHYSLYAKSYNPEHSKLSNSEKKCFESVIGGIGHLILPRKNIEIYLSPNDARLRSIRRLQNPHRRYVLLKKTLKNGSGNKDFRFASISTLQYKPERRYVACLTLPEGHRAVLKAYRQRAYKQTLAHIQQLDALGISYFPPLIGQHKGYGILLFEWREGELLTECWQRPDFNTSTLEKLAQQLASFHRGTWRQIIAPRKNDLPAIVQGMKHLTPQLHDGATRLVEQLELQLRQIPDLKVRCHGDFYAKQILCHENNLYWLDLDDISLAHPGRDIATFVAHLQWDVLRHRLTPQQAAHYEQVFIRAYQRHATQKLPSQHLYTLIALHLFQLIHHPFRNCETQWVAQTEKMLDCIGKYLQQGARRESKNTTLDYPRHPRIQNPFTRIEKDTSLHSLLQQALDPAQCIRWFNKYLPDHHIQVVEEISVIRYKPGKRLLLRYELMTAGGKLVLIGKIRAKGLHRSAFRINQQLFEQRHTLSTGKGWQVPQPLCMIPECQMWLQRQVPGREYTQLLSEGAGETMVEAIAAMSHSLHHSGIQVKKSHGVAQELAVLQQQLYKVAEQHPHWKIDIHKLYRLLQQYSLPLLDRPSRCIHRDFYPDQIMVDNQQLYLLDLDLACMGDPCLDIGNFIAHIQEQALREKGDLHACQGVTERLSRHYLQLSGQQPQDAQAIAIYQLLSLARHIAISQRLPERSHLTPLLLTATLEQVQARL